MKRRAARLLVLVVLALAAGGLVLAHGVVLPPLARWLDAGGPPQRTDYVMVLPGDENVRPFVAASLVKAGLAGAALLPQTETGPDVEDGIRPPTHEIGRQVLLRRGVPPGKIVVLEGQSASTLGDLDALGRFLAGEPSARVCIVTSHYHTRRARWTAAKVLGPRFGQVTLVSAPTDGFCADNWWRSQPGFMAVAGEYAKLAYFAVRFTAAPYVLLAAAAILLGVRHFRRRRRPDAPARAPVNPIQESPQHG